MIDRKALKARTAMATLLAATLLGGAAHAQSGAPIVYKGADGVGSATPASPQTAAADAATERPRVEFRYPDQPDLAYSANGVRAVNTGQPIAFSSSTSAISERQAQQYASVDVPRAGQAPVAMDPALSAGSFDARATAQRIAAQAAGQSQAAVSAAAVAGGEFQEAGRAGVYDASFDGLETANGEIYDPGRLSAAHPNLPLPSLVRVTNPENGREVVVRVNDRGPFEGEGIVDLSPRASQLLGLADATGGQVGLRYLGPAPVVAPGRPSGAPTAPVDEFILADMPAPAASAPLQQDRAYPRAETGFFVQVGSFSNIANAQRMSASLAASLFVDVVPARVGGADYFRVMVGPYSDRQDADRVRRDLASRGVVNGLVVVKP
ncbi:MAG: septal ring lytic transglycosylase RlpA family protein [Pseudomonadota bacterium]